MLPSPEAYLNLLSVNKKHWRNADCWWNIISITNLLHATPNFKLLPLNEMSSVGLSQRTSPSEPLLTSKSSTILLLFDYITKGSKEVLTSFFSHTHTLSFSFNLHKTASKRSSSASHYDCQYVSMWLLIQHFPCQQQHVTFHIIFQWLYKPLHARNRVPVMWWQKPIQILPMHHHHLWRCSTHTHAADFPQ